MPRWHSGYKAQLQPAGLGPIDVVVPAASNAGLRVSPPGPVADPEGHRGSQICFSRRPRAQAPTDTLEHVLSSSSSEGRVLRASFLSHQSQRDVQRFIYSLDSPLHSLKFAPNPGHLGVGVGGSANPSTTQRALEVGQAGAMGFLFQSLFFLGKRKGRAVRAWCHRLMLQEGSGQLSLVCWPGQLQRLLVGSLAPVHLRDRRMVDSTGTPEPGLEGYPQRSCILEGGQDTLPSPPPRSIWGLLAMLFQSMGFVHDHRLGVWGWGP